MPVQYQFCRVCRQNHDQGKGHRFSAKHKQRLDALLKKIQKNVREVRFFVKNAMRLKANVGSRSKFWCQFCEQEISEDKSDLACGETIRHLASKQHVEAVGSFWFENGGDVSKRQAFYISDADFGKWEEACKALPVQDVSERPENDMNNIHFERCLTDTTSAENLNQSSVVCGSSLAVEPLSVLTDRSFLYFGHANGKVQVLGGSSHPWAVDEPKKPEFQVEAHPDGKSLMQDTLSYTGQEHWHNHVATPAESKLLSSAQGSVSNLPKTHIGSKQRWGRDLKNRQSTGGVPVSIRQTESALGQNLTAIRPPSLDPGEGNVHSGAPPPWLKLGTSEGSGLQGNVAHSSDPSLPLSRTQQRKLAKLRNPNRVGAAWAEQRRAEIERERRGEAVVKSVPDSSSWLPSFGRVWQSGSRRETRKEFEAEKRLERRKKSNGHSEGSSDVTFDTAKIQPYVSKRQRTME